MAAFRPLQTKDQSFMGVWSWARGLVKDLNDYAVRSALPPGLQAIWHAAIDPPTGWLLCDGASYDVESYKALYSVIGYTYGGSGASFMVPTAPVGLTTIIKV